jgi:HK97 family phage major capsid protein
MPSTADAQIRDRLKEVRDQLSSARDRRAQAKKERDAARDAFAGTETTGRKLTEVPEFINAEQAVRELGTIDDEINELRNAESGILGLLGEVLPNENGHGPQGERVTPPSAWSGQTLLARSEEYARSRSIGVWHSHNQFGTINLGEIATRDDAARFLAAGLPAAPAGGVTTTSTAWIVPPDYRGIVPPKLMPLNLLDLIPTGTTDSNVVEYVQITAIPGSAAPVDEAVLKPQEGITAVDATAPVRTIAGWIKSSRQSLDDVAGLSTLINTLLPYDVRRAVMAQILAGDGTGMNLTGIYNTTGVAKPALVGGDTPADALLRAMTAVILSFNEPNFVAMNPLTWQDLMLLKNTQGNYIYGAPGQLPGGVVAQTIWGLPIVTSVIIPQANPLVGDSMGCTLLVREGVNVKTSDSDQDDFVRNRITVLAETRVAFAVWRPSAFAIAAQG